MATANAIEFYHHQKHTTIHPEITEARRARRLGKSGM